MQNNRNKKIILYSLSTCAFCAAIKKMFDDLKILHQCIQADELEGEERTEVISELKKVNSACSFPTVVIDDEVVVGYKIQEIKEKIGIRTEVDELYAELKKKNESNGCYLNGNKEKTFELLRLLMSNKKTYGYMACPCRPVAGSKKKDSDIICPCVYRQLDIEEFGSCFCSLYVSADWYADQTRRQEVPDRRPPHLYDAQ